VYVAIVHRAILLPVTLAIMIACGGPPRHGVLTPGSLASRHDWKACEHRVPEEVCVRCHPDLAASFRDKGDWCPEHGVPESQCLLCHPDLDFSPPLAPPAGADVAVLVRAGEDLPALEPHRVAGKVTLFDFYASWCPPCRAVDRHLYPLALAQADLAVRKINVVSWDTPIAARWLRDVSDLPYLVVYGVDGRRVAEIAGAKLDEIDRAIAAGRER
jgi:thiol-disulfide isomerase/thioredoxin